MISSGRMCLYCSKMISSDDRIALCDRCYVAHHEECWDRNGRCSTFGCKGVPLTMRGDDVPSALMIAMNRANEHPELCPYCSGKVYAGILQGRCTEKSSGGQPNRGLNFICKARPNPHKDWFGRAFLDKMLGNEVWSLIGAHIHVRSCCKCRRLYIWGVPVDQIPEAQALTGVEARHCPYCTDDLRSGVIDLNPAGSTRSRFVCDSPPTLHDDWLGRNLLDRYVYNHWKPLSHSIPALSCPTCRYTEIAGKPVYRFC